VWLRSDGENADITGFYSHLFFAILAFTWTAKDSKMVSFRRDCFYLSTPFVTVRSDTSTLPLILSFMLVRPVIIYTISCESPRLMFPVSPRVNLSHTRYRPHRRRRHLCAKPASRNFHGLHLEVSLHTQNTLSVK
jgi:hypothetical protein